MLLPHDSEGDRNAAIAYLTIVWFPLGAAAGLLVRASRDAPSGSLRRKAALGSFVLVILGALPYALWLAETISVAIVIAFIAAVSIALSVRR
jgi:hypothetical protein